MDLAMGMTRTRLARASAGVAVAAAMIGLAAVDPSTALWFSAPLGLLWLLVTGLTRPAERLIDGLRRRREADAKRAPSAIPLPRLDLVIPRVGRLLAAALAVRPPPAALPSSLPA